MPRKVSAEFCRGKFPRNYAAENFRGTVTEGTDHAAELEKVTEAVSAEPFRGIPRKYFRGRDFRPTLVITTPELLGAILRDNHWGFRGLGV